MEKRATSGSLCYRPIIPHPYPGTPDFMINSAPGFGSEKRQERYIFGLGFLFALAVLVVRNSEPLLVGPSPSSDDLNLFVLAYNSQDQFNPAYFYGGYRQVLTTSITTLLLYLVEPETLFYLFVVLSYLFAAFAQAFILLPLCRPLTQEPATRVVIFLLIVLLPYDNINRISYFSYQHFHVSYILTLVTAIYLTLERRPEILNTPGRWAMGAVLYALCFVSTPVSLALLPLVVLTLLRWFAVQRGRPGVGTWALGFAGYIAAVALFYLLWGIDPQRRGGNAVPASHEELIRGILTAPNPLSEFAQFLLLAAETALDRLIMEPLTGFIGKFLWLRENPWFQEETAYLLYCGLGLLLLLAGMVYYFRDGTERTGRAVIFYLMTAALALTAMPLVIRYTPDLGAWRFSQVRYMITPQYLVIIAVVVLLEPVVLRWRRKPLAIACIALWLLALNLSNRPQYVTVVDLIAPERRLSDISGAIIEQRRENLGRFLSGLRVAEKDPDLAPGATIQLLPQVGAVKLRKP